MQIRIKMEPQDDKPKNWNCFDIDENATIAALKKKLVAYLNVPVEYQMMLSLSKTFQDHDIIKEVAAASKDHLLMLYSIDKNFSNGIQSDKFGRKFICFIEIAGDMTCTQQRMCAGLRKLQNVDAPTSTSSSEAISISSGSTRVSSGSNEGLFQIDFGPNYSVSDSGITDGTLPVKKRRIEDESIVNSERLITKRFDSSNLEMFHKCNNSVLNSKSGSEVSGISLSLDNMTTNESGPSSNASPAANSSRGTEISTDCQLAENENQREICKEYFMGVTDSSQHPCLFVDPKLRQYLVIVSNCSGKMNKADCEELLQWFFVQFQASPKEILTYLKFNQKLSYTLYDGKLWIACSNMVTFDWIRYQFAKCITRYKSLPLNDFYESSKCEVVVPIVEHKGIVEIFDLFEKQNPPISTLYWCVNNCEIISSDHKEFRKLAASEYCSNELLTITIDKESKDILLKFNCTLKYSFWQLAFTFST